MDKRAKDMGAQAKKKGSKGDPNDPDMIKAEEADEDDEDDDADEDTAKSMSAVRDAIVATGDMIAKHLASNDPRARMEALLAKGMANGGELEQADRAELIARLQGAPEKDTLAARAGSRVTEGEDLHKAMGASPAFDKLAKGLSQSVSLMAEHIENSNTLFTDTSMLLLKHQQVLAKGLSRLADQQELLHAAQQRIAEQPQGGPRSVGVRSETPAMRKSVETGRSGTGDVANGDGSALEKRDITKGLRIMRHRAHTDQDMKTYNALSKSLLDFEAGSRMPDDATLARIAQTLNEQNA